MSKKVETSKILGIIVLLVTTILLTTFNTTIPVKAKNPEYPYGGMLRRAIDRDNILQPWVDDWTYNWEVFEKIYDSLLRIDSNWQISPCLAKSYEVSKDGKTWTFHLVDNANFHSPISRPLTSEDVKWTYEYGIERKGIDFLSVAHKSIVSIEAPDPYTVIFNLNQSSATFFYSCTGNIILPRELWEDVEDLYTYMPDMLIGSGPFKMVKQVPGQYLELEANEDYWDGRPYIDKIFYMVIPQQDMQLMALEKGDLDYCYIRATDIPKMLDNPNIRIYNYMGPGWQCLEPNFRRYPMNDSAFRRAVSHTVDRQTIIDTIYYGYAVPLYGPLLSEVYGVQSGNWTNYKCVRYEYNLTEAARILDEAGYIDTDDNGWRECPDGSEPDLSVLTYAGDVQYMRMAEICIENMRNVNIKCHLETASGPDIQARMCFNHDFDLKYDGWGTSSPYPGRMLAWLASWKGQPGGVNERGWANATFDALIWESDTITDEDKLRENLWKQQEILMEDAGIAFSIRPTSLVAVNIKDLDGWINSIPWGPLGSLDCYLEVHMTGALPAVATMLTSDVPTTGEIGEAMDFSATLTTEDGAPIQGIYIDFYAKGVTFGAAKTDLGGTASIEYVPETDGDYDIKAQFPGSSDYAESSSSTKTVSVAKTEEPEPIIDEDEEEILPKPDYTIYYIAAIIILIVTVAALYMRGRS